MKTSKPQALVTHSLTEVCDKGNKICRGFGAELVSGSEGLRLEAGVDCYNLIDGAGTFVGKIVPRLVEDEIWYGVNENISGPKSMESRGRWLVDDTVYDFYNIECEKYVITGPN
jgi:hypothetical protein